MVNMAGDLSSMKAIIVFVFCLLFGLLPGCSHQKSAYEQLRETEPPVAREYTDPSRVIRVKPGERFAVVLDSNATTGYSWQAPERTSHVSLNSHRYEAPQSPMIGAGGREHFEFTARSQGKETLVFHYMRPWERGVPPAKTTTFTVEVIDYPKK